MAAPLVSIILPTYNGARYLRASLDSCLAQTYPNIEVIVVDDASTDDATPQIIQEYGERDARVQVIRHAQNQRLPTALNTGFAAAHGTIFTWTSDDNLYQPTAIAVMAQTLAEHPEASFVYADFDIINEDGVVHETYRVTPPQDLVVGEHKVACFAYRREVADRLGGYATDLFLAEDYDYWLRIYAARFSMIAIHQRLYAYRRHAKSLTDVYHGKAFKAAETALLRHLPQMAWLSRLDRGRAYLHLAALATWQKQYPRAAYYTLKATLLTPVSSLQKLAEFGAKRVRKP